MSRRWFGTDGVRGAAGEGPLTTPFLKRLGQALGEQAVAECGSGAEVPIARDTRESGPAILAALAEGLAAAGARPIDLGVVPTPGLPLAMRASGAARGVVVSASHNPWRDNGVKVFGPGGHKLDDQTERGLEARIEELGGEAAEDGSGAGAGVGHRVGPRGGPGPMTHGGVRWGLPPERRAGADDYVRAMLASFAGLDLSGLDLAVDCAHGAATVCAARVLTALGARVTEVAAAPDGRNINDGCGSTHLGLLSRVVREGGHALGLAFDGDADRVLLVDAGGRPCTGDAMLGLLGPWMDAAGRLPGRTVVATVMSNLGLERLLTARGLTLLRTAVGDRYVVAAMREGGFALGGEDSGHLVFAGDDDHPGDGLYTALMVLSALADTGTTVAQAIDAVPGVPQVLLNLPVAARPPLAELPELTARAAALERQHAGELRIVLRYSGTENLARVMVEGTDGQVVTDSSQELAALWERAIGAHGSVPE